MEIVYSVSSLRVWEKLLGKGCPRIKKSLRFVQKLRNIMAHWELDEKKSNLKNIIMFTLVGKYRKITINDSLIDDYRKHVNFVLKEFGYSS